MHTPQSDAAFTGTVPAIYQRYLVPLIFEPYAQDLAQRLTERAPAKVLELAAGTGVLTRAVAAALPDTTAIVATDLNQAMLDHAASVGTSKRVEWRQADAMRLPFDDNSFDAVVCQFGVMFFEPKPTAFAEARRVLGPGGPLLFSTWDRIEENEFANTVTAAVASLFPTDPPQFLRRTPHGYHDRQRIARNLAEAGFTHAPEIVTVPARSRAESPRNPATGYCQGTPLRNEIVARDPARLEEATDVATERIARQFGSGAVDGKIQALVVMVER